MAAAEAADRRALSPSSTFCTRAKVAVSPSPAPDFPGSREQTLYGEGIRISSITRIEVPRHAVGSVFERASKIPYFPRTLSGVKVSLIVPPPTHP